MSDWPTIVTKAEIPTALQAHATSNRASAGNPEALGGAASSPANPTTSSQQGVPASSSIHPLNKGANAAEEKQKALDEKREVAFVEATAAKDAVIKQLEVGALVKRGGCIVDRRGTGFRPADRAEHCLRENSAAFVGQKSKQRGVAWMVRGRSGLVGLVDLVGGYSAHQQSMHGGSMHECSDRAHQSIPLGCFPLSRFFSVCLAIRP